MRVTIGIATYNRDTYLRAAIDSCLAQDYDDFEVLVVDDGSTNPRIAEILRSYDDPRLRVVRHAENRGISAAYDSFVSEGRGELIAMLGDDDVCLPGRLRRQVEVFDAHPETGVVHGDAQIIDAGGSVIGTWPSRDFTPDELVQAFFRSHNHLIDPTRMVHRSVYEAVGGYDPSYPIAQDMEFWLRAARRFRFRHVGGGPLIGLRRHGENMSDESAQAREIDDVERALTDALERYGLRELAPEVDWARLEQGEAERQALLRIADALEQRLLPLPRMAARLRAQAGEQAPARPAPTPGRRLLMTSFGWNDSGGGTTVPRLAARELAARGWDVTVFHAAVKPTASGIPYEVREWVEDGVRLIGVHNRPHGLFDLGNPARELDDPAITAAFCAALERVQPDVVHFHNLHNLGAALIDAVAARGLPAYLSTHNYWLLCPRAYLITGAGEICAGPGDGSSCAECVGSSDTAGHRHRLAEIRASAERGLTAVLAVSDAVRRTLIGAGYPPELIDVLRQGMTQDEEIWARLGADRVPGRAGEQLTIAFVGSAYRHKGPQLLVAAAQRTQAQVRVRIHGEISERFAKELRALDRRGVVELCGPFEPSALAEVLADVDAAVLPSTWWDCAPLAAAECRAARIPLIVPRLGGLAEAVREDVDGLLFDGLDDADLARALDRLAGEAGLLERLQAAIEPPRPFAEYVDELEACYAGERPGAAAAGASPARPAVRWQGDHGRPTSLSIVNTEVARRLGLPLERVATDGRRLEAPLPHAADVEVRHQWPPDLSPAHSGRLAAIVPWEFGAVPARWLQDIRANVDELWVPSEYVREAYVRGGLDPERVVAIPNGVDLDVFDTRGPARALPDAPGTRFLFVGGLIWRKAPDVLHSAWCEAFAERDDVTLVIKDFGADGIYRSGQRDALRAHAEAGALPRIQLLDDTLSAGELAELYRACDVLVHPYRGEGFAMPVLEAMACGLPAIVTEGGPTDEFCPPQAGWRIRAQRAEFPEDRVDSLETAGRPWVLEPDRAHLVELLRAAAADADERERRGAAARDAAQHLSWDAVAARYRERIVALAAQPRREPEPYPFADDFAVRVLATPAWRGEDRLGELLGEWAHAGPEACLYLLADPAVDGDPAELQQRVLSVAGTALESSAADVTILLEPRSAERDRRLHRTVSAYVPLHPGCAGHERMAREAGTPVLAPDALRLPVGV